MKELFQFGGQLSPKKSAITGVIGGIIILLLWYLVTTAGMISQKILPNPVDVIYSLPSLMSDYSLFSNIWYTISLNLTGYFYALIIAIPIGFLIGIYPLPRAMFQKIVEALRFIPIPSVSGILIAIFSIGFGMKSAFLAFGLLIYLVPVSGIDRFGRQAVLGLLGKISCGEGLLNLDGASLYGRSHQLGAGSLHRMPRRQGFGKGSVHYGRGNCLPRLAGPHTHEHAVFQPPETCLYLVEGYNAFIV
jgi:hypothetical protein